MGDPVDVAQAPRSPSDLIQIKIDRLRSQTYILRVEKTISVVKLKEKIALRSGVISGLQRLIFRGRVLKDDKFLSDYHVEAGHTLYLVVTRPVPRLSQTSDPRVDSHTRVIRDALTVVTLLVRLNDAARRSGNSMGNEQDYGPIRENWILSPSNLARVRQIRRQLLVGQVAECLSNISMLLEDRVNLRDPSSPRGRAVGSEIMLNSLGNSLIVLARATSRIIMGERPVVSVLEIRRPRLQAGVRAGNLAVATAPRHGVITRQVIARFLWPSPSTTSQQHVRPVASSVSPRLTTEEELEDRDSDSDSD